MMRPRIPVTFSVARKDIKILMKERGTLILLFVLPLAFMLALGGATGIRRAPKEEAITLPVVNLDANSEASQTLIDALNGSGGILCDPYGEAEAESLLEREEINRLLTIPANYEIDLQSGRGATLHLVNGASASTTKSEAVHRVVTGAAADLSLQSQLISSLRQMADMESGLSPEQKTFTAEIIVEQAQSQFERSRSEPLLGLQETWPEHLLEQDEREINPLNVYVPGFAVLFIFLTAQTTALSIYEEKKVGSFRRLQAAPVNRLSILTGKIAPNFIIGMVQIVVLFGAGVYLFPLIGLDRMSLGNDPLALVLVCLVLLLCSASLGLLIAGISRTEAQTSALSQVLLWIFGFAAIWLDKLSLISPFDMVGKLIPHTWATGAFLDLFVRGYALTDILPSILVLLGFTTAFLAIGLWRFEYL